MLIGKKMILKNNNFLKSINTKSNEFSYNILNKNIITASDYIDNGKNIVLKNENGDMNLFLETMINLFNQIKGLNSVSNISVTQNYLKNEIIKNIKYNIDNLSGEVINNNIKQAFYSIVKNNDFNNNESIDTVIKTIGNELKKNFDLSNNNYFNYFRKKENLFALLNKSLFVQNSSIFYKSMNSKRNHTQKFALSSDDFREGNYKNIFFKKDFQCFNGNFKNYRFGSFENIMNSFYSNYSYSYKQIEESNVYETDNFNYKDIDFFYKVKKYKAVKLNKRLLKKYFNNVFLRLNYFIANITEKSDAFSFSKILPFELSKQNFLNILRDADKFINNQKNYFLNDALGHHDLFKKFNFLDNTKLENKSINNDFGFYMENKAVYIYNNLLKKYNNFFNSSEIVYNKFDNVYYTDNYSRIIYASKNNKEYFDYLDDKYIDVKNVGSFFNYNIVGTILRNFKRDVYSCFNQVHKNYDSKYFSNNIDGNIIISNFLANILNEFISSKFIKHINNYNDFYTVNFIKGLLENYRISKGFAIKNLSNDFYCLDNKVKDFYNKPINLKKINDYVDNIYNTNNNYKKGYNNLYYKYQINIIGSILEKKYVLVNRYSSLLKLYKNPLKKNKKHYNKVFYKSLLNLDKNLNIIDKQKGIIFYKNQNYNYKTDLLFKENVLTPNKEYYNFYKKILMHNNNNLYAVKKLKTHIRKFFEIPLIYYFEKNDFQNKDMYMFDFENMNNDYLVRLRYKDNIFKGYITGDIFNEYKNKVLNYKNKLYEDIILRFWKYETENYLYLKQNYISNEFEKERYNNFYNKTYKDYIYLHKNNIFSDYNNNENYNNMSSYNKYFNSFNVLDKLISSSLNKNNKLNIIDNHFSSLKLYNNFNRNSFNESLSLKSNYKKTAKTYVGLFNLYKRLNSEQLYNEKNYINLYGNQFLKTLDFLKPLFIIKRFQNFKNNIELLKTVGAAPIRNFLKSSDLNFISAMPKKLISMINLFAENQYLKNNYKKEKFKIKEKNNYVKSESLHNNFTNKNLNLKTEYSINKYKSRKYLNYRKGKIKNYTYGLNNETIEDVNLSTNYLYNGGTDEFVYNSSFNNDNFNNNILNNFILQKNIIKDNVEKTSVKNKNINLLKKYVNNKYSFFENNPRKDVSVFEKKYTAFLNIYNNQLNSDNNIEYLYYSNNKPTKQEYKNNYKSDIVYRFDKNDKKNEIINETEISNMVYMKIKSRIEEDIQKYIDNKMNDKIIEHINSAYKEDFVKDETENYNDSYYNEFIDRFNIDNVYEKVYERIERELRIERRKIGR